MANQIQYLNGLPGPDGSVDPTLISNGQAHYSMYQLTTDPNNPNRATAVPAQGADPQLLNGTHIMLEPLFTLPGRPERGQENIHVDKPAVFERSSEGERWKLVDKGNVTKFSDQPQQRQEVVATPQQAPAVQQQAPTEKKEVINENETERQILRGELDDELRQEAAANQQAEREQKQQAKLEAEVERRIEAGDPRPTQEIEAEVLAEQAKAKAGQQQAPEVEGQAQTTQAEQPTPTVAAPNTAEEAKPGVGELRIKWTQQGDQIAPLTEIRAYLDSMKESGLAVGSMKLEPGADGKLSGSFGVTYDPNMADLAKLEGAVQGLKKVGNGLEVTEPQEQAQARRTTLGEEGREKALDLAFPVREAFGLKQWDALSARLSEAPKQSLSLVEQVQQRAGILRVDQVAQQQGKTKQQVIQDAKSLLDVDTSGNPVSAFLKNFYDHLNGGGKTRQTLEVDYDKTRQELAARLTKQAGNAQVNEQQAPGQAQPVATQAKGAAPEAPAQQPAAAPAPAQQPVAAPAPRFTKDDLPTEKLALFGLSADVLMQRGQLDKLLAGQKTDLLNMQANGEAGKEPIKVDGKLMLHREADNSVTLKIELPRQKLEIPNEIGGLPFTPEQRKRLETEGTAGLVRGLKDEKGEVYNGYVGVDKEMKKLVILPEKSVTFQDKIGGVSLTKEQSLDLREGNLIHVAKMAAPGGKPFDGTAQIQAAKAGIEIKPESYELNQRQAPKQAQAQEPENNKQKVEAPKQKVEVPKQEAPKVRRRGPSL